MKEKTKKLNRNLKKLCSFLLVAILVLSSANMSFTVSAEETTSTTDEALDDAIIDVVLNIGSTESKAAVTWYAKGSDAAYLQLAKKSDMENDEFPSDSSKYKQYTADCSLSNYSDYYRNSVTLSNLKANTEYVYRVSGIENEEIVWSDVYEFTCQDSSDSFGFLVVGDPQIGTGSVSTDTEGWIETMNTALSQFSDSGFIISVGDQIDSYSAGDQLELEYNGFLSESSLLTNIPLATAVGNHDAGRGDASSYSSHYTLPNMSIYGSSDDSVTGDEDYYFTYGNTVFMVLNTNNSSIAEHTAFIENTINNTENCTWRVVVFHQSIYSVASHVNDGNISQLRTGLSPVFTENDIDIVLMGHDHVYARSYIMGGETGMESDIQKDDEGNALSIINDADGVQYITFNSASGSKYYNITSELFEYTAVQNQEKTPNYSYVSVTDTSFTVTTYRTSDQSVVDTVTLNKGSAECTHENTEILNSSSATCTTNGYTGDIYCADCGYLIESGETIEAIGHTVTTTITRATSSSNGKIVKTCSVCNKTISKETIYKANKISLSKTSYTYNGKVKKPSVTVKDSNGNKLKEGTDYTVSYSSGCKKVGQYSVKISFKGNYCGSKTLTFKIKPASTSIKSKTSKSKGFTIKWNKVSSQISGYQVKYSTSKSFTSKNTVTKNVSKNKVSLSVSKLKANKKYYIKIRTYKTVKINGKSKKIYSSWSSIKSITTKK